MKIVEAGLLLGTRLQRVWLSLVKALTTKSELQVWQTCDRNGHACWRAYDPTTDRSACFGSEADMRAWIEQQYYAK